MEKAILNRWVLSDDLNCESEVMFRMTGGREFQSLGAERLKALLPMVVRRAEGTDR